MEKTIFIIFEVFDESIKQKAMMIASDCPGVNSVKVKKGGVLKVKGEFDKCEIMKKLKLLDENAEIFIEVGPDGVVLEPKVHKTSDDASSSKWITSQPNGLWEMTKAFGVGAAEQAKVIRAGAAGLILPNNSENGIKKQPKEEEGYAMAMAKRRKRFGGDQLDQRQEGGGIVKNILGYFEKRKKDTTNNSEAATTQGLTQGLTTVMGKTGSVLNTLRSTLLTGEASASKQPLSTGKANTSTQTPSTRPANTSTAQIRKKKSKPAAKKGKNGN